MKSSKNIKRFSEFLMNSWPASDYYFLNGWILRFNDGVTSRSNSVFPIRYTGNQNTLEDDIDMVEQAYGAHGLLPVYTMPEFHEPKNLKSKLLECGYHTFDHTNALGIKVTEVIMTDINNEFKYELYDDRGIEFSNLLSRFSHRNEKDQVVIKEITDRIIIPKKKFILAKVQEEAVGTLIAVLTPQGFLYIGDVLVHPEYRRQKLATSMFMKMLSEWAIPNNVKFVWLQVETKNIGALNLYRNLGMKKIYDYYYMKKNL